jgi:hypothetical protein
MGILREEIKGTKILNEIESSNIVKTEYDTATKKMLVEFKHGLKYEYDEVPHLIYTQFRSAKSQGSFFNTQISKVFKYRKLS